MLRIFLFLPFLATGCDDLNRTDPGSTGDVTARGGEEETCRTQGYWKNHPGEFTCDGLWIGDRRYTNEMLLELLEMPTEGDASLILAIQLIAAKFNVDSGFGNPDIQMVIDDADDWMSLHDDAGPLPFGIDPSSAAGQEAIELAALLDSYNNMLVCVDWELPD